MRETPEDLDRLESLLDASYSSAGPHLRGIHTDAARLGAATLVDRLIGMQVLVVATVTSDGRPLTGPVDGFLYRGRWCFGTSPEAVRARHLSRRPPVSATYVEGERLVVVVHGSARRMDLAGEHAGFADVLRGQYGAQWDSWGAGASYFEIEPDRMFAADMSVHAAGQGTD